MYRGLPHLNNVSTSRNLTLVDHQHLMNLLPSLHETLKLSLGSGRRKLTQSRRKLAFLSVLSQLFRRKLANFRQPKCADEN
jgi:hypothetical protein